MEVLYKIKILDETLDYGQNAIIDIFKNEVKVGRLDDCTLHYDDKWIGVSRNHAMIIFKDNQLYIKQLNNRNNNFINDKLVTDENTILKNNDIIQFARRGPKIKIVLSKRKLKFPMYLYLLLILSYLILAISICILLFKYFN